MTSPSSSATGEGPNITQDERTGLLANLTQYLRKDAAPPLLGRTKKRRKVHFEKSIDNCTEPEQQKASLPHKAVKSSAISVHSPESQMSTFINLQYAKNMCEHMNQHMLPLLFSNDVYGDEVHHLPLGYLEVPGEYKHLFYHSKSAEVDMRKQVSIVELLRPSTQDTLDLTSQLKLAHRIVTAVLQYQSTPWLSQDWCLQQFTFFGSGKELSEKVLRTLHVSVELPNNECKTSVLPMEGIQAIGYDSPVDMEDVQLLYGIRNMTLHCLGVALLELGYWKPLDSHDLLAVRRLAASRSPLGPKYQEIVQKCLGCDFGLGSDLTKTNLQYALYNDVVCPLESMMESLGIS